jgi:hypothetical protein
MTDLQQHIQNPIGTEKQKHRHHNTPYKTEEIFSKQKA